MLTIRALDTSRRRDVRAWIELPYRLYAGDPLWVPQMVDEAKMQLDRRRNPFFRHSEAVFFLAEQDGRAVGRLAVLENRLYNARTGARRAFFTHFETVEDIAVATALFEAAFEWCRRRQLDTLVGPKGFLTADGMGLLIEGFHRRPAIGIPYNPPFYHDFIQRLGFERETDFLSGYLSADHPVPERLERIAERVKQRYGFRIERYRRKRELRRLVPLVVATYNEAFTENWEYVPITPEEAKVIADRLLTIIQPDLVKLVWKDDRLVGFLLCYPDISAAIQRTGGRLWPFGWFHLLREFGRTEWVNINGAGILPAYRGRGVDALLFVELARTIKGSRYKHAIVVQIDEGNSKMQLEMAALGVGFDTRHRIFRRAVGPG
ncbi:MAG: hypothetical protein RMN24_09720 [Anaerolineae bacterium]|nr:hypothetical protein [Caldilineales bacterium]MDW8269430.1 hypothetical protein [Anaerolineae bacterium]